MSFGAGRNDAGGHGTKDAYRTDGRIGPSAMNPVVLKINQKKKT